MSSDEALSPAEIERLGLLLAKRGGLAPGARPSMRAQWFVVRNYPAPGTKHGYRSALRQILEFLQ